MTLPKSLVALVAAAAVSMARTPDGFQPGSTTDLIVDYNGITALNGAVISKEATANQPLIGTTTRLLGSSYAVLMIDLDIPTNTPPATNTLAHWIQTGLTPATAATTLNTTRGTIQAFLLENKGNTAAIAPYFGPSPPARIPLSHRYTQILVDTSSITAQGLQTLSTAVNASRVGFNAGTVLAQANLAGKVVAGNFYNVTNPGPVQAAVTNTTAATTTTTTSGAATGTAAFLPGTGTSTTGTALPTAAAADLRSSCAALGIVVVGAVMFGL